MSIIFYKIIVIIIYIIDFNFLVNNDNIVRLIDVFECDGKLHLIMEYCQGGDLRALIRKKLHEEEYFSYSQVKNQGSLGPVTVDQGMMRSENGPWVVLGVKRVELLKNKNSDSNLDDPTVKGIRSNTRG